MEEEEETSEAGLRVGVTAKLLSSLHTMHKVTHTLCNKIQTPAHHKFTHLPGRDGGNDGRQQQTGGGNRH